jgi:hypothetical protein
MEAAAIKHLSVEEAKAKAEECRIMAMRTGRRDHQIMLHHIAETWERIVRTMTDGH